MVIQASEENAIRLPARQRKMPTVAILVTRSAGMKHNEHVTPITRDWRIFEMLKQTKLLVKLENAHGLGLLIKRKRVLGCIPLTSR